MLIGIREGCCNELSFPNEWQVGKGQQSFLWGQEEQGGALVEVLSTAQAQGLGDEAVKATGAGCGPQE